MRLAGRREQAHGRDREETLANTFQTVVAAVPTVTCSTVKPQRRSIEYEIAMPTASPPGSTLEAAVEACDSTRACRNERPGSAAIQGGANVARLRIADGDERRDAARAEAPTIASQTCAVVGDARQDEREHADHERECEHASGVGSHARAGEGGHAATIASPAGGR